MEKITLNLKDFFADGQETESMFPRLSLVKLTGKKIKDIEVRVSEEFGDPMLSIRNIVFEDGDTAGCSGEHDIAYIEDDLPNADEVTLRALKEADGVYSGFGEPCESVVERHWEDKYEVEVIVPDNPNR